jgi:hypothetical protein
MANSTTNLDTVQSNAVLKESQANELFDAASPATAFGRRAAASSGLTWGFYGGTIFVNGVATQISNGTVSLTNSASNLIELSRTGVVSASTSGASADKIPLYEAVTSGGVVTVYVDYRTGVYQFGGYTTQAMSDSNQPLTQAKALCDVVECTGALTAQRNLTIPHWGKPRLIYNNTTGGFGVQAIGATGTGFVVTNGKHALVYSNGTNIQGANFP